jgi:hypothetical protein
MRCLYCNKKLSLLKLAKGDSFCSSEHFDAHQLQLSKNAFDRLMSLPAENAPKSPLVNKPPHEDAPAQARHEVPPPLPPPSSPPPLSAPASRAEAYRPPEPLAAPLPRAVKAPPFAPFANQQLSPFSPEPPAIANLPETSLPVQPAPHPALPVHEVEATVGMLNLYLQLSLSGIAPIGWEARPSAVVPVDFQTELCWPLFVVDPEFPEIEILAPIETILRIEAAPPTAPVPSVDAFPVEEPSPIAAPVLPAEPEAVFENESAEVESAKIESPEVESPELEAVEVENGESEAVPLETAALETSALETAALETAALETAALETAGVETIEVETVEIETAGIETAGIEAVPMEAAIETPEIETAEVEIAEPVVPRLPFLVAPSFRERSGVQTLLDGTESSAPTHSDLAPILNPGKLPHCDSMAGIPRFTRMTAEELKAQDCVLPGMASVSEVPSVSDLARPEAQPHVCINGWRRSKKPMGAARPPLNAKGQSVQPLDSNSPAPVDLMVCPTAIAPGTIDPQQLVPGSARNRGVVFKHALETRLCGGEDLPICPPTSTLELAMSAVLAPFPGWEMVASTTWQSRATHFPFPLSTADWSMPSLAPLQAIQPASACIKLDCAEKVDLPRPWIVHTPYSPILWPGVDYAILLPFGAEQSSFFTGTTILPALAEVPAGSLKTSGVPPALIWEARRPAYPGSPAARFLPVRNGAILPEARSWQRRDSLPT